MKTLHHLVLLVALLGLALAFDEVKPKLTQTMVGEEPSIDEADAFDVL